MKKFDENQDLISVGLSGFTAEVELGVIRVTVKIDAAFPEDIAKGIEVEG